MDKPIKHIVIAIAIILAVTVPLSAYVIGSYIINSNHVTGIVNTVSLTLTANNTQVATNDILMLTAQLNNTKSGVSIQFFNSTTALNPTVLTDGSGKAICYYNVTNSNAYDLSAIATYS